MPVKFLYFEKIICENLNEFSIDDCPKKHPLPYVALNTLVKSGVYWVEDKQNTLNILKDFKDTLDIAYIDEPDRHVGDVEIIEDLTHLLTTLKKLLLSVGVTSDRTIEWAPKL